MSSFCTVEKKSYINMLQFSFRNVYFITGKCEIFVYLYKLTLFTILLLLIATRTTFTLRLYLFITDNTYFIFSQCTLLMICSGVVLFAHLATCHVLVADMA